MFQQTFSGSSRRPRNVNLSGQNLNPFAANSWTPASGSHATVANAQQERLQRQQERERLNASKRIQRTWRGHKTRRELADARRKIWDDREIHRGGHDAGLAEQAKLLVTFFTSRRRGDLGRMLALSSKIFGADYEAFLAQQEVQPLLVRLSNIALSTLQTYVVPP